MLKTLKSKYKVKAIQFDGTNAKEIKEILEGLKFNEFNVKVRNGGRYIKIFIEDKGAYTGWNVVASKGDWIFVEESNLPVWIEDADFVEENFTVLKK